MVNKWIENAQQLMYMASFSQTHVLIPSQFTFNWYETAICVEQAENGRYLSNHQLPWLKLHVITQFLYNVRTFSQTNAFNDLQQPQQNTSLL